MKIHVEDDLLEDFLDRLREVAGRYEWTLIDGRKLRCWIEGHLCCPVQLLAYVCQPATKYGRVIPPVREMVSMAGISDQEAAAAVHHADGIVSRYWRKEWRGQMLAMCQMVRQAA